ncbi:hypothetical protein [Qipengyuania atrilutea]|uniref:Uracil-DNA glycosylase-like domain-containing protein n=1 Tax=Qipengyuania atrilutea TaxID=2744473 RepID=A0A850GZL7_9SPHN|nr:hypothetical protein [Actirhodobacter atriluteus]NVD43926.1 hypothetical protein [Actirhodobacter atriluteus]
MIREPSPSRREVPLPELAEAALEWWLEAGVDSNFSDDAQAWLGDPADATENIDVTLTQAAELSPKKPARAPQKVFSPADRITHGSLAESSIRNPENWPAEFSAFNQWWLSDEVLPDGDTRPAVAPEGPQGAPLMIVIPHPNETDRARLLEGPAGAFLTSMLAAMGLAKESVYLASVLPRYTPLPDWDAESARGLGSLARHHIVLAKPERVLLLGRFLLPVIVDKEVSDVRAPFELEAGSAKIPLLAAQPLGALARSAQRRRRFWESWLDWTDE